MLLLIRAFFLWLFQHLPQVLGFAVVLFFVLWRLDLLSGVWVLGSLFLLGVSAVFQKKSEPQNIVGYAPDIEQGGEDAAGVAEAPDTSIDIILPF